MKKTLALTLALVLALGLCAPALAAETDGTYYVDGQPVDTYPAGETTPVDEYGEEADPYAEYEAAHPEEIAALDADALIAQWGYHDMTARESFMEYNDWLGDTVEEAVKNRYIERRLWVQEDAENSPLYREEYPDAWASFDADAFFQEEYGGSKAEYMAAYCLFSEEEFVDDMFTDYIEWGYYYDDGYDWDDDWYDPDDESVLTLMVNGVASGVAVGATGGTTYADAADLRSILGADAVAPGYDGPVPIREAAENVGWDVVWYDGWDWQEVQLWDRAAFEDELAQEFGPFDDFLARFLNWDKIKERLYAKEPVSARETLDVTVTKFSTLNGNQDYKLTMESNTVYQNGVADATITFDMARLLDLVDPSVLFYLDYWDDEGEEGATRERLGQLLKDGKMELIADYNTGRIACRIPLLGLLDQSMGDWQITEFDFDVEGGRTFSLTAGLYDDMLEKAARTYYDGAQEALQDYQEAVANLRAFAGRDCFTTQGSKTVWHVDTKQVNRAAGEALGLAQPDKASLFRAYELRCTVDDTGRAELSLHLRPDVEGARQAAAETGGYDNMAYSIMTASDMDLTASFSGRMTQGTGQVNVHVDNSGKMDLRYQTSTGSASQGPRQIKDVEPLRAEPKAGTILTQAK